MNKRGFTLVEVLVTVVIIALLSGVGVLSYRTFFRTGEEKYFDATESNVLLAGNDYFTDHRDLLPVGNAISEVSLSELVESKYIEKVTDSKGNVCTTGKVYAYRENNKYVYEVCMECGGIKSNGKYCEEVVSNIIHITAKTTSGKSYDVTKTYNSVKYTDKENVLVTFSMDNDKTKGYQIVNTKTNYSKSCSGKTCTIEVDKSGTYKVTALGDNNEIVATNQYFNVRIAKNGPAFTVSGAAKNMMTKAESACKSDGTNPKKRVTYTIVKGNINEEYNTIKYQINDGEEKEINTLKITEDLESGHYVLRVIVSNFAGGESVVEKEINISYLVDVEYDDGEYAGNPKTHEVVSDQIYNYLSALPAKKLAYGKELDVRWHLNDVRFYPETQKVSSKCTHKIVGKMSIPVAVPKFSDYCAGVIYSGSEQTITKTAPEHITFTNNKKTNAGEYTITASIEEPQYIWQNSDGTYDFNNKTFKCSINKRKVTVTATDQSKTYDTIALSADGTCAITGQVSGHTVTCSSNTGSITNVGTADKGVGTVVIKDSSSNDVTSNYNITKANGTLTVNKRKVTVTATNQSKTYDATALSADATCAITGQVSGHTVTCSSNTGSITNVGTADKGVGTVVIKDSSSKEVTSNYDITKANGTLTVNKRKVTVTATNQSKTYDATALSANATCAITGQVSGHTVTCSSNTGSITNVGTATKGVGTVVIKNSSSNDVTSNYDITKTNGTLTVSKRTLNVAANNKTKYHTQDNPTLDYSYSNNVSGQTPKFSGSLTTPAKKDSAIGTYGITQNNLTLANNGSFVTSNYTLSFTDGTLTILNPCKQETGNPIDSPSCGSYGNCTVAYYDETGTKSRTCTKQTVSSHVSGYVCSTGNSYSETTSCNGATKRYYDFKCPTTSSPTSYTGVTGHNVMLRKTGSKKEVCFTMNTLTCIEPKTNSAAKTNLKNIFGAANCHDWGSCSKTVGEKKYTCNVSNSDDNFIECTYKYGGYEEFCTIRTGGTVKCHVYGTDQEAFVSC